MTNDAIIERWRVQRQNATRELNAAQEQAQSAEVAAATAMSADADLRTHLGSIAAPAPFIQAELKRSGEEARKAAEAKQSALRKVRKAEQIIAQLDQAAEQLKAAGIFKGE